MNSKIEIKDKLTGRLIESHDIEGSLLSFFENNIADFDIKRKPPISVFYQDNELTKEQWDFIPAETVVIYPEPKGAVGALILKAVVSYAINYAVNAIFGTTDNYAKTTPTGSSIYSVNAQGNSARLNGVAPQIFGTHKYYPDLLSQPWKAYESDIEYVYLMFSCGIGQYEFDEINIGNTPVSRYLGDVDYSIFQPDEDVTIHDAHRNIYTSDEVSSFEIEAGGYAEGSTEMPDGLEYDFSGNTITAFDTGDPYNWPYSIGSLIRIYTSFNSGIYKVSAVASDVITLTDEEGGAISFTSTTAEEAVIVDVTAVTAGDWLGPYLATPITAQADSLYLDIFFQGLGYVSPDGTLENRTVNLDIEYRVYDADETDDEANWITVTYTKTAKTLDELGDTVEINSLTPAVYEVRVRRTNAQSSDASVSDTAQWVRLKAELEANTSYSDITTLAVKIRGTNALSSASSNQFNTVMTRKLPIYDALTETWSAATATNDIAPVFAYIVQDSGLPVTALNLDELDELHQIWSARGDEFNGVFDEEYTLFDSLKKLLAVGYAEPTIDNGQIKPVRDAARSDYGQFFSYDNTTTIKESGTLFDPDEPDGVTVEYFSNDTWTTETIDCLLSGDVGEKPEEVRAFGITSEEKAWRYGMRIRRAKRYIRKLYDLTTELEAMNANVGDLVSVPNRQTQTGYVENYSGNYLYLNTSVDFEDGETYYIGVRKPDGSLSGPYECTSIFDDSTVELTTELDFTPEFDTAQDPPLFKFGTLSQWHTPAIVQTIEPQTDESANVSLRIYDERVYLDDDNSPP